MVYGVTYGSYAHATLATVLTYLANNKIAPNRIVAMYWNGSAHTVVYVIQ